MDDNDNSPWEYKPDGDEAAEDPEPAAGSGGSARHRPPAAITWQAAEFIEHPHGAGWYSLLVLITAALTAAVYFATKDYVATGTIVAAGIIVGVFVRHKPSTVEYEISASGITANGKHYSYNLFKSFSVLEEGHLNSVNLFPVKRFMPPISAYFKPDEQKKIVETLGDYLPYEQRDMDGIDRLTRRLRL